jgi:hypothetical protein
MSNVSASWDVAASTFAISDKVVSLLRAASIDNVQPSTVYVAEAIGDLIIVEPTLIGTAVDALGGGESRSVSRICD